MPDIRVHRHGDRWAVGERGAESPLKEFSTREAAELAARQMTAGDAVEVVDDDPTGLDSIQDPDAGEPVREDPDEARDLETRETSRSRQPGL